MKFISLLFLSVLSTIIFIGCEFVRPLPGKDIHDPPQTSTQLTQRALSNLANTANERGFVDLANAANEVVEVLAIETGTTTETAFLKLVEETQALQQGFDSANCGIKLGGFAITSERAANVFATKTAVETSDREQILENLAQEALNAEKVLQQFPTENPFIPFAFGYAPTIDSYENYLLYKGPDLNPPHEPDVPDVIRIWYDETIRPAIDTWPAVVEFLILKGYVGEVEEVLTTIRSIDLGEDVDPYSIAEELNTIPGVELAGTDFSTIPGPPQDVTIVSWHFSRVQIMDVVRKKYNEAWCQGKFDTIDSILIEKSGLDFFDYAFVRYLADIYAEEIPDAANRIQTNGFSLRSIAIEFQTIRFQNQEKELEEIIELFRQSIRDGNVTIEHLKIQDPSRSSDWTAFSQ